jgi:hypothetical protein
MREIISRRRLFSRDLRPVRTTVARAIAKADPIQLLALGAPGDEYDGEVGVIVSQLQAARSEDDVCTIVHAEFVRRFGDEVAGPRERYSEPAREIWRVVSESRRPARS